MALNLKNPEVERLAAEVAELARESKTEAVRQSLLERKTRLESANPKAMTRSERAARMLAEYRDSLPPGVLGKRLTRKEKDQILGYGPGGV